jgi:hypothetical protein
MFSRADPPLTPAMNVRLVERMRHDVTQRLGFPGSWVIGTHPYGQLRIELKELAHARLDPAV